jgi:hypothetical protein
LFIGVAATIVKKRLSKQHNPFFFLFLPREKLKKFREDGGRRFVALLDPPLMEHQVIEHLSGLAESIVAQRIQFLKRYLSSM